MARTAKGDVLVIVDSKPGDPTDEYIACFIVTNVEKDYVEV